MPQWHSFYRYFSPLFTTGLFTTSCQNPSLLKFLQDVEKDEDKIELLKKTSRRKINSFINALHLAYVSAIFRKEINQNSHDLEVFHGLVSSIGKNRS